MCVGTSLMHLVFGAREYHIPPSYQFLNIRSLHPISCAVQCVSTAARCKAAACHGSCQALHPMTPLLVFLMGPTNTCRSVKPSSLLEAVAHIQRDCGVKDIPLQHQLTRGAPNYIPMPHKVAACMGRLLLPRPKQLAHAHETTCCTAHGGRNMLGCLNARLFQHTQK